MEIGVRRVANSTPLVVVLALSVFAGMLALSWLLSLDGLFGIGGSSFASWEGEWFGYPDAEGWRPSFLKKLLVNILLPSLAAGLVLRRLPPTSLTRQHSLDAAVIVACQVCSLLLFHYLGRQQTYGDWLSAVVIGLASLLTIVLLRRLPAPPLEPSLPYSAVWFLAVTLLAWVAVVVLRPGPVVAVFLFNLLFVSFAEEYAFRGVIQGILLEALGGKRLCGISGANLATALLFALFHNPALDPEQLPWLIYTFSMGLAYGVVRERTGTWLVPALAHGCNAFYFLYFMLARSS